MRKLKTHIFCWCFWPFGFFYLLFWGTFGAVAVVQFWDPIRACELFNASIEKRACTPRVSDCTSFEQCENVNSDTSTKATPNKGAYNYKKLDIESPQN
eukprot:2587588-Amphidinium_carterae.1